MTILLVATCLLAVVACRLGEIIARRLEILAHPNARSSHRQATPSAGGVAIFAVFFLVVAIAEIVAGNVSPTVSSTGSSPFSLITPISLNGDYWVVLSATAVLVAVGVFDDLAGLSVRIRLPLYALAVVSTCAYLLRDHLHGHSWEAVVIWMSISFALLWLLNLYNFMDGIDGFAGLQTVLACVAAAFLADPGRPTYILLCLLLAAAHSGFLVWNWPPAKLFMGDAGSIPTGFLLGALALLGWTQGALNPACWLILLALFVIDATWTLFQRLIKGEVVTQAHKKHAYQRLSRHWQSHRAVDIALLCVVGFWLFPFAVLAHSKPDYAVILVIFAYLPWVICMAKIQRLK